MKLKVINQMKNKKEKNSHKILKHNTTKKVKLIHLKMIIIQKINRTVSFNKNLIMTIIIKSLKIMINHLKNIAYNLFKVSFSKKKILTFLKTMIKLKKISFNEIQTKFEN